MSDLKVQIPLHKAKDIGYTLNNARGLIGKCYIQPIFKKSIMALLDDAIFKLHEGVKLAEKARKV